MLVYTPMPLRQPYKPRNREIRRQAGLYKDNQLWRVKRHLRRYSEEYKDGLAISLCACAILATLWFIYA